MSHLCYCMTVILCICVIVCCAHVILIHFVLLHDRPLLRNCGQMEAAGAIHNLVWPLAPTFDHWGGTITKECLLPTSRIQSD